MEIHTAKQTTPSYIATATSGINDNQSDDILHLLQYQLSKNIHHSPQNTLELIKIIGGIDKILKDYVFHMHPSHFSLDPHQLNQIYQLIHNSSFATIQHDDGKDTESGDIAKHDPICYEFCENDSYLHAIFGKHIAVQMMQIMHTEITMMIMGITGVVWMVLNFISNTLLYPIYVILSSCVLWIPFFLIYFLSGNIVALKMILNSFEFWLKIFYAVFFSIMTSIHVYHYGITHGWNYPILQLIASIFQLIDACFLVLDVSSFDAHNISAFKKIFISTIGALLFTFNATRYSFLVSDSDDLIVYITPNNSISIASVISSSCRILAIFMWRQAILCFIRSKKQKCVLIQYIPSVKWNNKSSVSNERDAT